MVDLSFLPSEKKISAPADAQKEGQGQQQAAPPPILQQQIVSAPDNSQPADVSPKTRYLSDRDATTEREQVKRGEGPDAGIPGDRAADKPAPPAPPKVQEQAKGKAEKPFEPKPEPMDYAALSTAPLRLDDQTLKNKFGDQEKPSLEERVNAAVSGRLAEDTRGTARSTEPFSRPSGSGATEYASEG